MDDLALDMGDGVLDTVTKQDERQTETRDARAALPVQIVAPILALAVEACGGGGSPTPPPPPPPPAAIVIKPKTDAEAARFLLQAQFSASDAEITTLKADGYIPWLDAQMAKPVSQTGTAWLSSRNFDKINSERYFDNFYPGIQMIWQQLLGSNDPVRKRVSFALTEFFVIGFYSLDMTWRSQAIAHYWDQINANAFGSFRKLLEDITLNPAMGRFLNTNGNAKEDEASGRRPDENYAREVMQLFTIGLNELNIDGTDKLDANGMPIPTYKQTDVSNLARVFTGFEWDATGNVQTPDPGGADYTIGNDKYTRLPMTQDFTKWFYPQDSSTHSTLEAKFLGKTVAANTNATEALKIALDALFNHANAGPFFAKQMIKRLVTSNPSPAYVGRVAAKFNDNGSGTRGDLKAVFKAILVDDEARGAAGLTSQTAGKLREPAIRLVQWGRTFGVTSPSNKWEINDQGDSSYTIGQQPLASPSVFNFFRPGYVPAGTSIAANKLVAPEFQLVNEVSTSSYINSMDDIINNGLSNSDVKPNYDKEIAVAGDAAKLTDRLCLLLAGDQMSSANKTLIKDALAAIALDGANDAAIKLRRVTAGILLIMASSQYLIQK
jgi:uncharacterized protein (DUF1800 family)